MIDFEPYLDDSNPPKIPLPEGRPDFAMAAVLHVIVQQLKSWCPIFGRRKVADILARTGLHISASTVRRIINEPPIDPETLENLRMINQAIIPPKSLPKNLRKNHAR